MAMKHGKSLLLLVVLSIATGLLLLTTKTKFAMQLAISSLPYHLLQLKFSTH